MLSQSQFNYTICQANEIHCVSLPVDGYGSTGNWKLENFTIETTDPSIPVFVYCPKHEPDGPFDNHPEKFPIVFFLQALDGNHPIHYVHLLFHIVSKGSCVVFATVDTVFVTHEIRYNQLWNGVSKAVNLLSDRMDTSKIGFVGHSFGAGAAPSMYKRALEAQWGSDGAYLFLMSPWFVFDMAPEDWPKIPWQTRIYIQVYEDDRYNDQEIAIREIWDMLDQHPPNHRQYALVRSDRISQEKSECSLPAGWGVPMSCADPKSINNGNRLNGHDVWAVWRRLDAVQECAFEKSDAPGCALAFDIGPFSAETFMGFYWGANRSVKALQTFGGASVDRPEPTRCNAGDRCTWAYTNVNETYFSGGSGIGSLVLASVGSATALSFPICCCCCLWGIAIVYHTTIRSRMKQEDSYDSSSSGSEEEQRVINNAVPASAPVQNPAALAVHNRL